MPKDKSGEKILKRRSGVLVPLFSVYSKKSFGIGDLEDLKLLIDWCGVTGNSILQLLPMNEVGSTFCPYDSISSFALEPMYISVQRTAYNVQRKAGLKTSHVDYRIKEEKERILHSLYLKEKGLSSNAEFIEFKKENEYWINDYSLFKGIKSCHRGTPWHEWNDGYKERGGYILEQFAKEHESELDFYKWVQWIAFKQFKDAKEYAWSKKVLLKGDLPILVSADSADVWAHPDFFKLEYAAGAPPDMYCAKGQRWGMPTYNWDHIEADEFIYVKEKLRFAENFYDILRIDHVAGLFRIWSIPSGEPVENRGLNGFFNPADENAWGGHGKKLLSVLRDNTDMILCAEDLGIIPKVCRDTLKEMGIPGNDVERWMKDWEVKHDFLKPDEYRRLAVAMLSTHDTTNWAAWWENEAGTVDEALFVRKCGERGIDYKNIKEKLFDPSRSKHKRLRWREDIDSAEKYIRILGKARAELNDFLDIYENTYLEKEKLWKILGMKSPMREGSDGRLVRSALGVTSASRSIFNIELIFDLLSLDDICKGDPYRYRVNTPGTVGPDNWSLTIPISLEELLEHKVNKKIKELVLAGERL